MTTQVVNEVVCISFFYLFIYLNFIFHFLLFHFSLSHLSHYLLVTLSFSSPLSSILFQLHNYQYYLFISLISPFISFIVIIPFALIISSFLIYQVFIPFMYPFHSVTHPFSLQNENAQYVDQKGGEPPRPRSRSNSVSDNNSNSNDKNNQASNIAAQIQNAFTPVTQAFARLSSFATEGGFSKNNSPGSTSPPFWKRKGKVSILSDL